MIDLLGKSQTLFGVLATVVVLCIFKGSSNFIFQIVDEIRERIKERVKKLKVSVDLGPSQQKLSAKLKDESDTSKAERYGKLMSRISELQMRMTLIDMVAFFDEYAKKFERIKTGDEILRGPLFTFLYIFVIFLFDEYLRSSLMPGKEIMFTAVSFFTLFSSLYWALIWLNYIHRCLCQKDYKVYTLSDKYRYLVVGGIAVVYLIIYFAILFVCHILLDKHYFFLAKIFYVLGILIPCVLFGLYFIYTHPKSNNGYYMSVIFHLVGGIFFSVVFAIMCHVLISWKQHFELLLVSDVSIELTKLSIFLFSILNGLMLPFFCPLLCSYWVYRFQARAQVLKKQDEANKMLDDINKEMDRVM